MGIAGVAFAVMGLALSIIPTIGWVLTTICLVVGTGFSTFGLVQSRSGSVERRRAILGMAVNAGVIVIMVLWIFAFLEWESSAASLRV